MGASQSQPGRWRERMREQDRDRELSHGNNTTLPGQSNCYDTTTNSSASGNTSNSSRREEAERSQGINDPLSQHHGHAFSHSPSYPNFDGPSGQDMGQRQNLFRPHQREQQTQRDRRRPALFQPRTRSSFLSPPLHPTPLPTHDDHGDLPDGMAPHRRGTIGRKISSLLRRNMHSQNRSSGHYRGHDLDDPNTAKRERSASSSVHQASPGRPVQKRRRVAGDRMLDDEEEFEELDMDSSQTESAANGLNLNLAPSTTTASGRSSSSNNFASLNSPAGPSRPYRHPLNASSSSDPYPFADFSPRSPGYSPSGPSTPVSLPDFGGPASASAAATAPPGSASASSPTDELLADRLRTISTIRDALGSDWTPASSSTSLAPVERLFGRFRRSSHRGLRERDDDGDRDNHLGASTGSDRNLRPPTPSLSNGSSAATTASPASSTPPSAPASRSLSHRLSAIMGFASSSADEWEEPPPQSRTASTTTFGPGSAAAAPLAPAEDTSPSSGDDPTRIPVGAVLVIQGLAQTHANIEETPDPQSTMPPTPGSTSRRRTFSEPGSSTPRSGQAAGSGSGTPAAVPTRPRIDIASLDQQARMIGNLLTVAAAATATTLLSPTSLAPQQNRTTVQSAMQTILERFRPQRSHANQSIESTLGEYLRTVLRDNRRFAEAVAGDATSGNIPSEFQDFLHTLQHDLILAVRAYAVPDDGQSGPESGVSDSSSSVPTTEHNDHESADEHADEDLALSRETTPTPAPALTQAQASNSDPDAIPTFHRQRGQNLPGGGPSRLGVSGGSDGVPRRLNFFRAHLFPSVGNSGERATDDDANAVVPSIFVGVRSVTHDPSMTTEDLVGHPGFPFLDGQVPEPANSTMGPDTESADDELDAADYNWSPPPNVSSLPTQSSLGLSPQPTPAPASPRRTLRERVRDRFSTRREPRPHAPLNTYLIYVIGGNYPRSHPVLAIPSLVSGGPMTAEDLALVSELLGPAKPPTATSDEISRSGLAVVAGKDLTGLVGKGSVLEASLERCMVCLSDYEPEEECRVLKCRHAFHKECVDHWLSQGRNSCPACRTEAVDKNSLIPGEDKVEAGMAEPAARGTAF